MRCYAGGMSTTRRLIPFALFASLACAGGVARAGEARMPYNAFLFELRLGGAASVTATGVGVSAVPSILVGGRLVDRLHLGLGFSFFRFYNDGNNSSNNVVNFVPTVSIDAFRSSDRAFAFYVKMGLPLGVVVLCTGNNCTNDFAIGFDIAVGGRYLFHRHFALGLEGGMAGTFVGVQRGNIDHVIAVYGALVGTIYF